ncbi:YD repeat-containing protein [Oscillochloris trichoides DG-6]|uniref:YD repeat-containing protein n=1 Tax=Oscillochloris trichoides DG-6 TaxID=765420 RepID=E1III2_9CHLR|nr:YD repeat-containing protein [Oscillochloris trichoides]EFO79004.1 YD repeat-containing protein [Oscillochloris trichoides DG-6]
MQTPDGEQPISAIRVGDLVLAYNEATGSTGAYTVTAVISHSDALQLQLTIDGETLETTPDHPFLVLLRGWVKAGDLQPGMAVRRADGSYGAVQDAALERQPQTMYNLTVAGAHTFFVGDEGWLVHNEGCGRKYSPTRKHKPGGWGTEMDLSDDVAQEVLNQGLPGGRQIYGYHNGKIYEFQPDNQGGYHGYPVSGTEAPPSVLKELLASGKISRAEYNRLRKGK